MAYREPPPDPRVPVETTETTRVVSPSARRVGYPNYRAIGLVWFIVGIIDVLLGLRFVFRLLGASQASNFVATVYQVTGPLAAPFRGIFPTPGAGPSVLELATLLAMLVYALIGWGLVTLIRIATAPRGAPPAETY